ncbi:MAG TPA: hypothetical protein VM554_11060 [Acidisarcina sp.]|nr:hypothetical protein [Acidisarcina sp.]
MGKFRVKVKLTGLEIEVEGDREFAPEIAQNVSQQLGKVLQAPALIGAAKNGSGVVIDVEEVPSNGARQPRRRKPGSGRASASSNGAASSAINWEHDAARFGTPKQDWKAVQKIAWLLYVLEESTGQKVELTPTQVENTFNGKFRSAGLIRRGNVARDLGNNSDQFGEVEGKWFLKDVGRQAAIKLVAETLGLGTPTPES